MPAPDTQEKQWRKINGKRYRIGSIEWDASEKKKQQQQKAAEESTIKLWICECVWAAVSIDIVLHLQKSNVCCSFFHLMAFYCWLMLC